MARSTPIGRQRRPASATTPVGIKVGTRLPPIEIGHPTKCFFDPNRPRTALAEQFVSDLDPVL